MRASVSKERSTLGVRCHPYRRERDIVAPAPQDDGVICFADVYSTAISIQNFRPLWDRRVLAGVITALVTAGALWLNIADYENFLTLLGSVFVPVFVAVNNGDTANRTDVFATSAGP